VAIIHGAGRVSFAASLSAILLSLCCAIVEVRTHAPVGGPGGHYLSPLLVAHGTPALITWRLAGGGFHVVSLVDHRLRLGRSRLVVCVCAGAAVVSGQLRGVLRWFNGGGHQNGSQLLISRRVNWCALSPAVNLPSRPRAYFRHGDCFRDGLMALDLWRHDSGLTS
jgi:hypothetical protein